MTSDYGRLALILCLLFAPLLPSTAMAQEDATTVDVDPPRPDTSPAPLTAELLNAKIAETEAAADLSEESRSRLLALYLSAQGHLEQTDAERTAAQGFREALKTAPAETRAILDKLAATEAATPTRSDAEDDATSLAELEATLQQARGDLARLGGQAADLTAQLDALASRPGVIRQRQRKIEQEQTENQAQRELVAAADETPAQRQARAWAVDTRALALAAEQERLAQELLSQPVRIELLNAKREQATRDAQTVTEQITRLDERITERRQAEAERAKAAAEAKRDAAQGQHPLVVQLAERNATLSQDIAATVARLDEVRQRREAVGVLQQQLEGDFASAREVIAIGGANLSGELGALLRQQRQALPDLRTFEREARERDAQVSAAGVNRVLYRREQQRIADADARVAALLEQAEAADATAPDAAPAPAPAQLLEAINERQQLLGQAIEVEDVLLRELGELEAAQTDLLETIRRFDRLLDEHLLWVRSASQTELAELGALPDQVWRIVSPAGWAGVAGVLLHQATHSAVFVLLGAFLIGALWSRRYLIRFIHDTGKRLGKPTTDRFVYTLQALAATVLGAAAWPLLAAAVGWQLQASPKATDFSMAVGAALVALAIQLYFLRALRLACMPHGLAAVHFRWPGANVRLLRQELDRLTWSYLPAAGVMLIIVHLDPLHVGWMVGRVAFLVLCGSLAFAFYRVLHPRTGVFAHRRHAPGARALPVLYEFWFPLLVIVPLAVGVLEVLGYLYTAQILIARLVQSTWMVLMLVLIAALAQRWVKLTRRRIAYEQALERRRTVEEAASRDGVPGDADDFSALTEVEEPEADLDALSDTTGRLIATAVVASGVIGLWIIWSDVIPALRVLDNVQLWQHNVTVDGEERLEPTTLADLGLALVLGIATFVFARQIPAVLEMILLRRQDFTAGGRYTVTTLVNYAIVTAGLLMVFATLGVQWSQLQWLVAALGVGIGFGLQEIVANFISGLIILFERPVRVGDIVTVGDTDGVVTKIQIRATTIRNWDRKELLVPNKEFVTGRLLNWSLSDQMTRVVVVVGVAYGSDVDRALELMRAAAQEHEHVLDDPAPILSFEGFGDNSLTLILRAYLSSIDYRIATITELHKAINRKFAEAGIVIAFPQRDLHLDTSSPLRVELRRVGDDDRE
jgi:potassium efflux system protein